MLQVASDRIVGLLPSDTPLGVGVLVTSYEGILGNWIRIQVVSSSFGIFTVNQVGYGPGVITDSANRLVTLANPASVGVIRLDRKAMVSSIINVVSATVEGTFVEYGQASVSAAPGVVRLSSVGACTVLTCQTYSGPAAARMTLVVINGQSTTIPSKTTGEFICTASASAGEFQVPAYVLSAVPVSSNRDATPAGFLSVGRISSFSRGRFTAQGLNVGYVYTYDSQVQVVGYR